MAVAAVLDLDDGKTLLVKRAPGRAAAGYWTPVTGRVEPGETLAEACVREVREETGLAVIVGEEMFRCDTVGADFELVWLAVRLSPGEDPHALRAADEIAEARFVSYADAAELAPMFAVTRAFYAERAPKTC